MKTANAAVALLLSMVVNLAQAESWYLGASAGLMDNNVNGYDDATNVGALLGYDFYTHEIAALSLEGELTTTVAKGDISHGGNDGNWDIDTQAAYIAMRLGNQLYMKVRYGVRAKTSPSSGAVVHKAVRTPADPGVARLDGC